ncbi:hypothetical protein BX666DRAFT_1938529 [Dichotomocladium elegans]|nr:hypothetical protein BX666DRAFT_1938529 [Dichotomocladium elegans]
MEKPLNKSSSNSSIGFATYQLQDCSDQPSNDFASIILFFSVIVIILLSFVFYFWITRWHKVPAQQRREDELEDQKEIDQLVENFKQQVYTLFRIPLWTLLMLLIVSKRHGKASPISAEQRRILAYRLYHLLSFTFMLATIIALAVLVGANTASHSSQTSGTLQAALFVFVLGVNLYFITCQRCYYKERRELFGSDDAHMNAVYKTRFDRWDGRMWSNWVQIAILIIEFFQLLAFPLRDLITVNTFGDDSDSQLRFFSFVSIVMNAGGFMPDMRTPTWYTYSLWTVFAVTMVSLFLASVVSVVNRWRPYKIPDRWVYWCIPVTTLLYIPILTNFVSSAACQSLNVDANDYADMLRCSAPHISQPVYFWMSLAGYVVAYFLLTVFVSSYERIPVTNEIAFKSISVAFIKNMGLLLAIVYLLVETTTNRNRMRAILSIVIILTMICYNIKTQPCYVDKINFFRTASFSCILWTSLLVAILSDTNAARILGPLTVLCIIVGGWGLIIVLYLIIYFAYYKRPIDYSDDEYLASASERRSIARRMSYAEPRRPTRALIPRHMEQGTIRSTVPSVHTTTEMQENMVGWASRWWRQK